MFAALERREIRFERVARRIPRARILVAFVAAELRLHVGRRLKDGDRDGARLRLRLLSGVNALGGKPHDDLLAFGVTELRIEN